MATDTLISLFQATVSKKRDKTALRRKDLGVWKPISWNEYNEHVKHFCLGMRSLGLEEGGKVAILS